jgi:hypothetical protein
MLTCDLFRQFKKLFTQYLVSTAARSSGCYIKCNTQILAEVFCNDQRDELNKVRFCPRPNKVCQLQCWSQEHYAKDRMFWGFDRIDKEPLNIDITQEMRDAYEAFRVFGNHVGNDYWDVKPDGNPSHFRLPVCDSDAGYVDVTDFKRGDEKQNKAFPASCGTWRSDEVQDFMDFTGLGIESQPFKEGNLHHLYFTIIPRVCVHAILHCILRTNDAGRKFTR